MQMLQRDMRHYPSRHPPVYTGRVWVGIAHVPRPARIDGDALRLQSALLDPRTAQSTTLPARFLNALWRVLA